MATSRVYVFFARVSTTDPAGSVVAEDVRSSFAPILGDEWTHDGYRTVVRPEGPSVAVEVPHGARVADDWIYDLRPPRGYTGVTGPIGPPKLLDLARRGLEGFRILGTSTPDMGQGGADHAA